MINVYCDESCHLPYDQAPVMVLGAMSCPAEQKDKIYSDIRAIKTNNHLDSYFEIKWTKVSESKVDFYIELLQYYKNNPNLGYRCLVATGKNRLDHDQFNLGNFDLWYYKMYYLLLDAIIDPSNTYKILLDRKDTQGGKKVQKLHDVLCNNIYDFKKEVIKTVNQIDSKESEILQLTDLLNGAIAYFHRSMESSESANKGKILFLNELHKWKDVSRTTSRSEQKFNLFIWTPKGT